MSLPTDVQRDILRQAMPMMSNEALLEQFEYWIRQGMGKVHWALSKIRQEILARMAGAEPV